MAIATLRGAGSGCMAARLLAAGVQFVSVTMALMAVPMPARAGLAPVVGSPSRPIPMERPGGATPGSNAAPGLILPPGSNAAPGSNPPLAEDTTEAPDPRRSRLTLHQALGLAALGGLALTGVAGLAYYQQRYLAGEPASSLAGLSTAHLALATATGGAYLSAAALALSAPGPELEPAQASGIDSIWIHRSLAVLHAAGMGSTIALGLVAARSDPAFTEAHRILGFTTLGLMAASAAVLAIDF